MTSASISPPLPTLEIDVSKEDTVKITGNEKVILTPTTVNKVDLVF